MDARKPPPIPKKAYLHHLRQNGQEFSQQTNSSSSLSTQSSDQFADSDSLLPIKRSRIDSFSSQLSLQSSLGDAGMSLSGLEDEGTLQLDEALDFDSSSLYIGNQLAKSRGEESTSGQSGSGLSGNGTSTNEQNINNSGFEMCQSQEKQSHSSTDCPDSSEIYNCENSLRVKSNSERRFKNLSYSSPYGTDYPTDNSQVSRSDILGDVCPDRQTWDQVTSHKAQESVVGSSQEGLPKRKTPRRITKNKKMPEMECQVCGDVAAGFYCGAFICEACKKFYMRAHKQDKVKYMCLKDKNCIITKESRVQCQYCRYEKCLKLNMYYSKHGEGESKDTMMSEIPCRVCSAPSSGFHFGAITCEGCKGFFRRMAKEREPERYQCTKKSSCEINMITRNLCKACRYRKCLDVGMSVEGSRIGRQPNSVKHAISLELKHKIKTEPLSDSDENQSVSVKEENCMMSCKQSTSQNVPSKFSADKLYAQEKALSWVADGQNFSDSIPSVESLPLSHQDSSTTNTSQSKHDRKSPLESQYLSPQSSSKHVQCSTSRQPKPQASDQHKFSPPTSPPVKAVSKIPVSPGQESKSVQTKRAGHIQVQPENGSFQTLSWTPANKRQLIEGIVEAGKCLPLFNYRIFDTEIVQNGKIDDVLKEFKAKFMGTEEGRREAKTDWSKLKTREDIWEYTMNGFNHNAYITIRFAKRIPGFRKLLMTDQVKLIQAAIYPLVLLNHSRVFDLETKQYNYFNFSKDEERLIMETFPMLRVLQDHFVHMGTLVKTYSFTNEEFTLLSALILLPSEVPGLEKPDEVQTLQNEISEALQHYEEKTFKDGLTRYGVLLVRVAELIQCSLQHNLAVSLLLAKNPTIKVPQLYQEIIMANVRDTVRQEI